MYLINRLHLLCILRLYFFNRYFLKVSVLKHYINDTITLQPDYNIQLY